MSERDLCEWAHVGKEMRNLEYKGSMRWDSGLTKEKVVKTALSMSNIRDGGWIVIGVAEQSKGFFERVGLSEEDANTFNSDDVSSYVNAYADPYVRLDVKRVSCDEKKFVIIRVEEFEELPVICKKEHQSAKMHEGKMYSRSRGKNENSEISTSFEMREIIDLAVEKNTRKFFETLKRVGVTSEHVSLSDEEAFKNQLGELG